MKYRCPVCGYQGLDEPAYHDTKKLECGSFEICECCQFQFGLDDDVEVENGEFLTVSEAHSLYRTNWLNLGAPVFRTTEYPLEFQKNEKVERTHLEQQLKNIGVSLTE